MFDCNSYGSRFAELLDVDRARPLDAGSRQSRQAVSELADALGHDSLEQLFADVPIRDQEAADACISGLWLLADVLEASHEISQSLDTAEGSFWHGIMHRREGDFSNAKYWFRRVGSHPVFDELTTKTQPIIADEKGLHGLKSWDPAAFVDLCQAARRDQSLAKTCRRMQQAEWEHLFDYCYNQAVG